MEKKQVFEKYYSRLSREGMLKALLLGLIVGFSIQFVIAFATWFTNFNGLWVSIGAGLASALICAVLFYFLLFRPTTQSIARQLDKLGLEERLVTMLELENDQSYIAMRQREDAQERLSALNKKDVKFTLSKAVIIAVSITAAFAIAMSAVTGMSSAGIMPKPGEFIPGLSTGEEYFAVSYMVEEGGYIEGEEEQLVLYGEDASPIVAVADDGWVFDSWDDGSSNPARADKNVRQEIVLTAIFVPLDDDADVVDGDNPGDEPSDRPVEPGDTGDPGTEPSPGASGKYEDHNQIIDGETYYRDVYQEYYDRAMQILSEGGEIPNELREIIEAYFGIII